MAYAAWSVVYGEQPTASKWNILGTNDASFNDGTGIANNAIKATHTEELPKLVNRQGQATNATITDPIIKSGWYQSTASTAKSTNYAITFDTAFDNVPIVNATIVGYKGAGATDCNAGSGLTLDAVVVYADLISTTGFTLRFIATAANLPNVALLACWNAIGKKAR